MSYFVRELEAVMSEHGVKSYTELSAMSGISESSFSQANAGSRRMKFSNVRTIAACLDKKPITHARLLAARLRDELTAPGGDMIAIDILGGNASSMMGEAGTSPAYYVKLPPKQETAMRNIAAAMPSEAGLRDTILWLGLEVCPTSKIDRDDDADIAGTVSGKKGKSKT